MTEDSRSAPGGCSRKVGADDLERVLARLTSKLVDLPNPLLSGRVDLPDATFLELTGKGRALATTTDLVFATSSDHHTSGYIAAVHAVSDLFAVLAEPLWATPTIGLPQRDLESDALFEVLSGIIDGLADNGVAVAGGHTVHASDLFVNVSATGVGEPLEYAAPEPGDVLLLSKPLGTGIAMAGLKLGLVDEPSISAIHDSMMRSNRAFAAALRRARETLPGAVRAVTDVSGYGFLNALSI